MMATASQVLDILNQIDSLIQQMNSSIDADYTRQLALKASSLPDNLNWGSGQKYIDSISDGFLNISFLAGTDQIISAVEQTNEALDNYLNYLSRTWWQFGASDTRSSNLTLPSIKHLH